MNDETGFIKRSARSVERAYMQLLLSELGGLQPSRRPAQETWRACVALVGCHV